MVSCKVWNSVFFILFHFAFSTGARNEYQSLGVAINVASEMTPYIDAIEAQFKEILKGNVWTFSKYTVGLFTDEGVHELVTFNSLPRFLRKLEVLKRPKEDYLCRQAFQSTVIGIAKTIGRHGPAHLLVFTNHVPPWNQQSVKDVLNQLSESDVHVTVVVFSRPGEQNRSVDVSQNQSAFMSVVYLSDSDTSKVAHLIGLLTSLHDDLLLKKVLPMGNTTTHLLLNNQYDSLQFTALGLLDSIAVETESGRSMSFSDTSMSWTNGYVGLISEILIPGRYVLRITTRTRATTLIVRGQFRSTVPRFCDAIDDVCLDSSRYFSPVKDTFYYVVVSQSAARKASETRRVFLSCANCSYRMVAMRDSFYTDTPIRIPHSIFYLGIISLSLGQEQTEGFFIRPVDLDTPLAVPQPSTIAVNQGKQVRLVCATSSPDRFNTYSWRFPTYIQFLSSRLVATRRDVVISNITVEHEGTYHCNATNSRGFAEVSFHLKVQGRPVIVPSDGIVYVALGEDAKLQCPAFGHPRPKTRWFKQEHELRSGDWYELSRNGTLTIFRTVKSDSAVYLCMVSNQFGYDSRKTRLVLKSETKAVTSVIVGVGQVAYLDCSPLDPNDNGVWNVTWWNGDTLLPRYSETFSTSENGSLVIKSADFSLAGLYTCVLVGMTGKHFKSYMVTVQELPQIIEEGVNYITARDGEQLSIACSARGYPPPTYSWTLGSEQLADVRGQRISVTNSGVLYFKDVVRQDEGNYTCIATNSLGSDRGTFSVVVEGPPYLQGQDTAISVISSRVDSAIHLDCPIRGHPRPDYVWFHNSQRLALSDRVSVATDGSLDISVLEKEDSGSYICKASNSYGEKKYEYKLSVETPPQAFHDDVHVTAKERQRFVLSCNVSALPAPTVMWFKHGTTSSMPLSSSSANSLIIPSIAVIDAGIYSCVASNYLGSITVNIHVVILVAPVIAPWPQMITGIAVPFGISFTVPCEVSGVPPPTVRWLLNGTEVRHEVEDGFMRIVDFTEEDRGSYTCVAINEAGQSERHLQMDVDRSARSLTWSQWSACSRTCRGGFQIRRRQERCSPSESECTEVQETRSCSDTISCPVHGQWSDWKFTFCSVTCGVGIRWAYRDCNSPPPSEGGRPCSGFSREAELCNEGCCPVDGYWSEWSSWSRCSKTCGRPYGTRTRQRKCDNPSARCKGNPCPGHETQKELCNDDLCPVDGDWSVWQQWSPCTKSCNRGYQSRTRFCNNPRPTYGGQTCSGFAYEAQECNKAACPVHGQWSPWTAWSACSRSCGFGGRQDRTRTCTNPPPRHGGRQCPGHTVDHSDCNRQQCPVHGGWTSWSTWQLCSRSCGGGETIRVRRCTNPRADFGGRRCPGQKLLQNSCGTSPCPVHGQWSSWGPWTPPCSQVVCTGSIQHQKRGCNSPAPANGGRTCPGHDLKSRTCGGLLCPVNGGWAEWSSYSQCTRSCGGGQKSRFRRCDNPRPWNNGIDCQGSDYETVPCNTDCCAVAGGWSEWTLWSTCDLSCGRYDNHVGLQNRQRSCSNPSPQCNGAECSGNHAENRQCKPERCPINGGWSSWGSWSSCSVTCGGGRRSQQRSCNSPTPQFGGSTCPGSSYQEGSCNAVCCPVHGQWNSWTSWSSCSVSCAFGTRSRSRACNNPSPHCNGNQCPGSTTNTEGCYAGCCPVSGGWGSWSLWSLCSAGCGSGSKSRKRLCNLPSPSCGGSSCSGVPRQTTSCCHGNCYKRVPNTVTHSYYNSYVHKSYYYEGCGFLKWDRCRRTRTSYRSRSAVGYSTRYSSVVSAHC